ncbi:MAG: hypothetical protein ICV55_08060 [Coleofasciculus sp. C3-bin4]|nr:hypothetical protein [Coleofasciculus sp. C3-bin4]
MKLFVTALAKSAVGIALTSTFLFTQGCSSQVKSGETSASSASKVASANHHEGHGRGDSITPGVGEKHHSGHSESAPTTALAKLTVPSQITPKTSVPLVIEVRDKDGKAIANFDKFQEKLMHLIVVSDDLQYFNHIHPTYKGNGRFEVQTNFPYPGSYTLFSDYKPAGKSEQVSVLKAQVPGKSPAPSKIDLTTTKTLGNTKANLKLSQTPIKTGKEVNLIFHLQDAASNQPLNDLQPYLGERGHLVILKQSSPLSEADYIHAHALKDTPADEVHFITNFPTPGKYKLWGQFNRNGKIVTADYWVNVK